MKIEIIWYTPSAEKVDLTDYGHDEDKDWNDLSVSERDEILDHVREDVIPMVKDIRKAD